MGREWLCLTPSVPQNEALVLAAVLTPPMERDPHSANSIFIVLEKHSQTETGFKMNFLPMKGENSITFYCVVLMFKLAKMLPSAPILLGPGEATHSDYLV